MLETDPASVKRTDLPTSNLKDAKGNTAKSPPERANRSSNR